MELPYFSINGIPIHPLPAVQVDELITGWLRRGDCSRQVVTINAVMLNYALRDPEFAQILHRADLVTVDGYGVRWALQMMGQLGVRQYPGVSLTRNLLSWSAGAGCPVFFYGGSPRIAEALEQVVRIQWPTLIVCGIRQGFGGVSMNETVAREIIQAQPRLLLVGLGSPEQELFLAEVLPKLKGTVGIGVGGSFEILAGCKREAPGFVREHGLEWLYRMVQDPRKLRRIPDLVRFWGMVMREARGKRQ